MDFFSRECMPVCVCACLSVCVFMHAHRFYDGETGSLVTRELSENTIKKNVFVWLILLVHFRLLHHLLSKNMYIVFLIIFVVLASVYFPSYKSSILFIFCGFIKESFNLSMISSVLLQSIHIFNLLFSILKYGSAQTHCHLFLRCGRME
jgi:hypothetical protein